MKMPQIDLPHFSRFYIEANDFKQAYVVAKNETIKNVRGKKFLVSVVIIVLVFALITLIPIMLNQNIPAKGYGGWVSNYLSYVTIFVALIAALIGSVSIVSEYEERTALIIFTRPIKKTSIYLGKFISSFLLCTLMMIVYYIGVAIVGMCYFNGKVSSDLLESLAMCIMYVFAAVCIAFLFSAIFKKGAVSIIATILTLVVVIPIISMMITGDKSFMLDTAANSTLTCIPEYLASYNKSIYQTQQYFNDLLHILNTPEIKAHFGYMIPITEHVRDIILSFMKPIEDPNLWRDAAVMFTWGAISLIAAWVLFLRKQF